MIKIDWEDHKKFIKQAQNSFFVYGLSIGSLFFGLIALAIYRLSLDLGVNEDLAAVISIIFLLLPLFFAGLRYNK